MWLSRPKSPFTSRFSIVLRLCDGRKKTESRKVSLGDGGH